MTALDQSITASDDGDASSEQLTNLIETNTDIQPGDSGGSLVNTSGKVIGIDTAASAGFSFEQENGASGNQGFAIPINQAMSIANEIEAGDASSTIHIGPTGFLGVSLAPDSGDGNGYGGGGYGYGGGGYGGGSSTSGALIEGVVTSSPAQEAGLAQGDIVTSVDGHTVGSDDDVTNDIEPYHPGSTITIGWTDTSGQSHTTKIQLTSGPPQ